MANWVRDFLEKNPELSNRIVKRARHALHTLNDDGTVTARFTGAPMHYQDEHGEWQAIDTAIRRLANGKLGAPGISIEFDDDGQVYLEGYSQVTRRVGVWNANTGEFVQVFNLPTPKIDDDKLMRETGIYKHVITLKEEGLREELIIKEKPPKIADNANLWLVLDTTITGQEFKDGWVDDEAKFEKGEFRFIPPKAQDANDNELSVKRYARKIGGKQHLLTGIRFDVLYDAVYPVTIDPDFTCGTADGYIYGNNATYSTARSTSNAGSQAVGIYLGQMAITSYYIYRGFVLFDTSSIPDDANITQVNLKLTVNGDASTTDFDVQIVKTDWSSNTDFSNATQRENAYDACLADAADDSIWRNTSGMSTNTNYTSGNLSTAWVSKTGTSYYGLRSSRDKSATAPSGNEYINLYDQEATTASYRPVLVVAYTTTTAYTLACAAGSYSLTGTACMLTVQFNYVLSCAAGEYTLTGSDAGFEIHRTLAIDAESYVLAGVDATLTRGYTLAFDAGLYEITGANVTLEVKRNYILSASAGSYTQTGADLSFVLQRNYILSLETGGYSLTGVETSLTSARIVSAEAGSYSLTGIDAILKSERTLSAGAGNYVLTGTEAGLHRGYTLSADAGNYALSGVGAGLYRGYSLSVIAGNYTLTGADIAFEVLQHNYIFGVAAGEYTLTGTDCILTPQFNYILALEAGSYTLTGNNIVLQRALILAVDSGDYSLVGLDLSLLAARILSMGSGAFNLTGADIALIHGYILSLSSGSFTLIGSDISLLSDRIFFAETGIYILTGSDDTLLFMVMAITPACRALVIEAENRTLTIEAENRTLTIEACKDGG